MRGTVDDNRRKDAPRVPRRRALRAAAVGGVALALAGAACSPAANNTDGGGESAGRTTLTFRIWDPVLKPAYQESFEEFEKQQDDIRVRIEVVPWDDYWTKLPQDVGGGNMADVFWTNTSNFGVYADNGSLLEIGEELKGKVDDWQQSVVDLYTRDDKLWGVPQLWDSIALYYNEDLTNEANVDPTKLRWDPSGKNDTFLPALEKLTTGETYGFNASNDPQGVYWDFVGSNGGNWQQGDKFATGDDPKTAEAMQYLVDLINEHQVAPPAADTNNDSERTKNLFLQGKLGLFQSGPYSLKEIHENAEFEWGIAPIPEGPAGRIGVVHGVAAVGYADTEHQEETYELLRWLGSAEGQRPIAEGGYAFPGVTSVEDAYIDYWKNEGVDLAPFQEAARGDTFPAPLGPKINAGANAMADTIEEIFLGREPVESGLKKAEQLGNDAME